MESFKVIGITPPPGRNIRLSKGGVVLTALLCIAYWLPIGWWTITYLLHGSFRLPKQFPFLAIFGNTFLVSSVAALAAIIGAYPIVLLWRLSRKPSRHILVFLMVIPLVMGLLARNYSWIGMLSTQTLKDFWFWRTFGGDRFLFSTGSVYVVMACIFVPVAFFMLIQGAVAVRPEHIEAARTLGLPDWKIVFAVIIPQTSRAAALAFGLIFTMAVGYFVTPRMIGGGKIDFVGNAILMYLSLGKFAEASAVALAFLGCVAVPASIVTVFAMRRRMLTTGR